jgi:hypothetical protein
VLSVSCEDSIAVDFSLRSFGSLSRLGGSLFSRDSLSISDLAAVTISAAGEPTVGVGASIDWRTAFSTALLPAVVTVVVSLS